MKEAHDSLRTFFSRVYEELKEALFNAIRPFLLRWEKRFVTSRSSSAVINRLSGSTDRAGTREPHHGRYGVWNTGHTVMPAREQRHSEH